jgi:ABC-2 type transport system ATP-binding protein
MPNGAPAIEIRSLTKRFGREDVLRPVLDNLTLNVESGQVYGFLGQNGAGKTTTIRILLDLVRPTDGETLLFGIDPRINRTILQRVGALVEEADFYPYLSGKANLQILAQMSNLSADHIDGLLARVGLTDRADQKYRTYSTGMRQRLGIAAALLGNPDLIILDEPTNGMDPIGMIEVRELIRELVDRDGKTVFLSSHQLGEVEQVCDRVAFINNGRLVREGKLNDLLSSHSEVTQFDVDSVDNAIAAINNEWPVTQIYGDSAIHVTALRSVIPQIIARLVAHNVAIYEVKRAQGSLEALFLSLVTGEQHG